MAIIKNKIEEMRSKGCVNATISIIEVPLLFEAGMEYMMDRIIVVYLNREEQIKRLHIRNNLTQEEAINRIDSQMSLEKKLKKADYVIDNSASLSHTRIQVKQIWQELSQLLARST
jgi:dephospho-CoA kinase